LAVGGDRRAAAHCEPADELEDRLADRGVAAHVPVRGRPALQLGHFLFFAKHDADRHLARPAIVRAVERDCRHGIAAKAPVGLLGEALGWLECLQAAHLDILGGASPRAAVTA
jgi:hypothetical protein